MDLELLLCLAGSIPGDEVTFLEGSVAGGIGSLGCIGGSIRDIIKGRKVVLHAKLAREQDAKANFAACEDNCDFAAAEAETITSGGVSRMKSFTLDFGKPETKKPEELETLACQLERL